MPRIPESELTELKATISLERLVRVLRRRPEEEGRGLGRPLPVSQGQDAVVGGDAGHEPVALPRRLRCRR